MSYHTLVYQFITHTHSSLAYHQHFQYYSCQEVLEFQSLGFVRLILCPQAPHLGLA